MSVLSGVTLVFILLSLYNIKITSYYILRVLYGMLPFIALSQIIFSDYLSHKDYLAVIEKKDYLETYDYYNLSYYVIS